MWLVRVFLTWNDTCRVSSMLLHCECEHGLSVDWWFNSSLCRLAYWANAIHSTIFGWCIWGLKCINIVVKCWAQFHESVKCNSSHSVAPRLVPAFQHLSKPLRPPHFTSYPLPRSSSAPLSDQVVSRSRSSIFFARFYIIIPLSWTSFLYSFLASFCFVPASLAVTF